MKVRVTESQFLRIKEIKEHIDSVSRFREYCINKAKEADIIFNRVSHLDIGRILNLDVDMGAMEKQVQSMENEIIHHRRTLMNVKGLGDEAQMEIFEIADLVIDKLTTIGYIVGNLETLQNFQKTHNMTRVFNNPE